MKTTSFSSIIVGNAFSPALGSVGHNSVYVKRENGICPQMGTYEESIFFPDDRVVAVRLPEKLLKQHR